MKTGTLNVKKELEAEILGRSAGKSSNGGGCGCGIMFLLGLVLLCVWYMGGWSSDSDEFAESSNDKTVAIELSEIVDENRGISVFKGALGGTKQEVNKILIQKKLRAQENTKEDDRKDYFSNVRTVDIYEDIKIGNEVASRTKLIFYLGKLSRIEMNMDDIGGRFETGGFAEKISDVYGLKAQHSTNENPILMAEKIWTYEETWSWSGANIKTRLKKNASQFGRTDPGNLNVTLECFVISEERFIELEYNKRQSLDKLKRKRKEEREFEGDF